MDDPLIKLGEEAEGLELNPVGETLPISAFVDSKRTEDKLKQQTLPPLIWFYIYINLILTAFVFAFGVFQNYLNWPHVLITDRVIIALISGVTVQVAAVIIAAYRGLFG